MKTEVLALNKLFGGTVRYVVPNYQRPYVWGQDRHWEPLWSDLSNQLERQQAGNPLGHFMGAVVLQQEGTQPGQVPRHLVIDGQQRLTTLQILMSATVDAANEFGADRSARLLRKLVQNDEDQAVGDEIHKVWPTESDRGAFGLVMNDGGPPPEAEVDPNNSVQEAYAYFREQVTAWLAGGEVGTEEITSRARDLQIVISELIQVVSISLEANDDPQVIFETLNARGTPLLAMDLVKNAMFHRLTSDGEDTTTLHDQVWQPQLGQDYWRDEVRQGRLLRPRAELFLMHWLTVKLKRSVRATDLFPEFRGKILEAAHAPSAREILVELNNDASVMRSFDAVPKDSSEGRYFRVIRTLDTTTFFPLTLLLYRSAEVGAEVRLRALQAVESFLIRRMLMGMSTKQYNNIGVSLVEAVSEDLIHADRAVASTLTESGSSSFRWPLDAELKKQVVRHPMFGWVSRQRLALVLGEIEMDLRGAKTEDLALLHEKLSIEHVMPQTWRPNWPLPTGPGEEAAEERESHLHVLGNLTVVTTPLNSGLSNQAWEAKRAHLAQHSVLLLNNELAQHDEWNEATITARGERLADKIIGLWPGPETFNPDFDPSAAQVPRGENDPVRGEIATEHVRAAYVEGSDLIRAVFDQLAANPNQRRTYAALEAELGWSRGRLASVLGGFANRVSAFDGKRPFRLVQDEDGTWWIWMDEERSAIVSELAAASQPSATPT